MKLFGIILLIIALAVATDAGAQHCAAPFRTIRHHVPYVAPVVEVAQVLAAQLLVVPVAVPSYTVGIQQQAVIQQQPLVQGQAGFPVQAQAQPDCMAEIRALRAEMAQMRGQALPQPQQQPLPQPQIAQPSPQQMPVAGPNGAQAGAGPHGAVMNKNCASCHDKGVAGGKGKGVVLFDAGNLVTLSADMRLNVIDQILSGKMPPAGKLTDEEVAQVLQGMTARTVSK